MTQKKNRPVSVDNKISLNRCAQRGIIPTAYRLTFEFRLLSAKTGYRVLGPFIKSQPVSARVYILSWFSVYNKMQ